VRTLHRCDVVYTDVGGTSPGLAVVLEGDGFLYNMVRIVAGTSTPHPTPHPTPKPNPNPTPN